MNDDTLTIWRTWRRSSRRSRFVTDGEPCISGLCFRQAPGPLLAIAGLSGGAGASALAYLTAATAAEESPVPVLVADTGGPTAGVAAYSSVCSAQTLAAISERLARREQVGAFWAEEESGLRVLAGEPQFTVHGDQDAIRRVLGDAQAAHGLSVVDTGTLSRPAEQAAMSIASHLAWVLSATEDGVARARRVLARVAPLTRPEILVARAQPGAGKAPLHGLADLADERRAPLVLMPYLGDLNGRSCRELASVAGLTLQAIGGFLKR
jgi:hypothetical protein